MENKMNINDVIDYIEGRMETIEHEFISENKQSIQKSSQDFGRYVELNRLLRTIRIKNASNG